MQLCSLHLQKQANNLLIIVQSMRNSSNLVSCIIHQLAKVTWIQKFSQSTKLQLVFYPKYSPILSGLGERRGFSFTTCGNSQRGPDFLRVPSLVPTFKLLFTFTNLGLCFCKVCFDWGGSFWLYQNCTMRALESVENLKE